MLVLIIRDSQYLFIVTTKFRAHLSVRYKRPDDALADQAEIEWVNKGWVQHLLRACALLSLISVSMNTPKTFQACKELKYITLCIDIFCGIVFTAEMGAKIHINGLIKPVRSVATPNLRRQSAHSPTHPHRPTMYIPKPKAETPYLKSRWGRFDFSMTFFIWVSVILQVVEMAVRDEQAMIVTMRTTFLSILRTPRPLIMIRIGRMFLKFQLPANRLKTIFKRSSQQIYNVTLFFLFFMSLYGILGVQFFGALSYHCVTPETNESDVSINDLAIPDTHCSINGSGYQCPKGMVCMKLDLDKHQRGFNGFDEFATSFFTVYEAASQEGWVFMMYKAQDSMNDFRGLFYFITLIFFLAWLVKNVFIAVITETFAEIRVQFAQMWGPRNVITNDDTLQILKGDDNAWKLVMIDENKPRGTAPHCCQLLLQSSTFHIAMLLMVLANALTAGSLRFKHDGTKREDFTKHFYYAEVAFTILFDLEALFKIWCLGFKGYFRRSLHKFELLLAISTTFHVLPSLYHTQLTYFQVLRVVRLIKASPMLEEFVYKIFGPGKKLGSLIIFTMCLLIITSSISLQLFCYVTELKKFDTFPEAFMSMFQILTQEGWIDIMIEAMTKIGEGVAPVVAIYFIVYHMFITLIVLSLFVAVILDNLELDEDIKKLKQLKIREAQSSIKQKLPLRLRIYEKFPNTPQIIKLAKLPSEFNTPKVRESFMRQFADEASDTTLLLKTLMDDRGEEDLITYHKMKPYQLLVSPGKTRFTCQADQKKNAIISLIRSANRRQRMLGDAAIQSGMPPGLTYNPKFARLDRRSVRGSLKGKAAFDHLKENGDIMGMQSSTQKTQDLDIKMLQHKKQQAENKRNQQEEELRENHPFFDTPLYIVGRESRFRLICKIIVNARYKAVKRDPSTGMEIKSKYKQLQQSRKKGLKENLIMISLVFACWMPDHVEPNSGAQVLMILRCLRPIRIFILVPHMRDVVYVLCRGCKEMLLVSVLLIVLMFVFASYGVQLLGLQLARCNDVDITTKEECVGVFMRTVSVAQYIKVRSNETQPMMMVPRIWANPYNFNFDNLGMAMLTLFEMLTLEGWTEVKDATMARGSLTVLANMIVPVSVCCLKLAYDVCCVQMCCVKVCCVHVCCVRHCFCFCAATWIRANPENFNFDTLGSAMLALFEILSFKGWLDIRDVIIQRLGPVHAIYVHIFVFIGCMIGLTLFVGVVIANYSENKGTACSPVSIQPRIGKT
ncbi:PREDICTED: sodium leak channel non-selective protein-like [Priapulus caudatus]|uniref:Sodium leak channel non-selective protein-like n=1 Tax=Priapulus caudatus TaxID=37621 RepID=A0ABM1EQ23_PRICU|nr:PREDICTED: sodium leak channel non-selective protein-like [Priapulus caudatus]